MDELLSTTGLSQQNIELLTSDGRTLTLNDLNALGGSDLIISVVGTEEHSENADNLPDLADDSKKVEDTHIQDIDYPSNNLLTVEPVDTPNIILASTELQTSEAEPGMLESINGNVVHMQNSSPSEQMLTDSLSEQSHEPAYVTDLNAPDSITVELPLENSSITLSTQDSVETVNHLLPTSQSTVANEDGEYSVIEKQVEDVIYYEIGGQIIAVKHDDKSSAILQLDDNTDVALSAKLQTAEAKQGILDVDTNASDQKLVLATPNVQGPDHDAQTEDSMLSNGSTLVAATMADTLECDGLTQSEVQRALNQQQVITVIQKGEKQYLISNHEEHMPAAIVNTEDEKKQISLVKQPIVRKERISGLRRSTAARVNQTRTDVHAQDIKSRRIRERRYVTATKRLTNTNKFAKAFRLAMRQLWLRGHLCDAIVMCRGGVAFTAHSSVLSAASSVFAQCLSKASAGSSSHFLSLVTYAQEDVALVLDFIYGNPPTCGKDWSRLARLAISLEIVGWDEKESEESSLTDLQDLKDEQPENAPQTAVNDIKQEHGYSVKPVAVDSASAPTIVATTLPPLNNPGVLNNINKQIIDSKTSTILGSVTALPPQKKRVGRRPRGDHLCKICNKVFLTELNLRQHKSEHKPVDQDQMYASIQKDISSGEATLVIPKRIWSCDVCKTRSFSTKASLVRHHRKEHTQETPFVCELCGRSFYISGELARHMREIHRAPKHECNICHKRFRRAHDARMHLDTHSEQPRYQCDQCGARLRSRAVLRKHIQCRHSNNRPYVCTVCQKGFYRRNVLKAHMSQHTGIYPHKCTECSSQFSYAASLKSHIAMNHSDNPPQPIKPKVFTQPTKIAPQVPEGSHRVNLPTEQVTLMLPPRTESGPQGKLPPEQIGPPNEQVVSVQNMPPSQMATQSLMASLPQGALLLSDSILSDSLNGQQYILSQAIQCPLCEQSFLYSSVLQEHLRNVHGQNIIIDPSPLLGGTEDKHANKHRMTLDE